MSDRTNSPDMPAETPSDSRWTPKDILDMMLQVLPLPLAVFIIFTFILAIGFVNGSSMEPTYNDNTFFISSRWTKPECQDVVSIQSSALDEMIFKRVIGLPGDTLEIKGGVVYRNEQVLEEPYVEYLDLAFSNLDELVIPENMLFVMGDNRPRSLDSRNPRLGLVPEDEVVGTVVFTVQVPSAVSSFFRRIRGID